MVEFLNESIKKDGVIVDGAGDRDGYKFKWSISAHTENGFVSYGSFLRKSDSKASGKSSSSYSTLYK